MGLKDVTQMQERQIRDARLKGIGYRAIASTLGLDRDTVRYYCVKYKLTPETGSQGKPAIVRCPQCGQPVVQQSQGRHRKFCCDECRRKWWAAHPKSINRRNTAQYHKTCAYCGKDFVSYGNAERRYCCHNCYIRDRFWKAEVGCTADTADAKKS